MFARSPIHVAIIPEIQSFVKPKSPIYPNKILTMTITRTNLTYCRRNPPCSFFPPVWQILSGDRKPLQQHFRPHKHFRRVTA